MHLLTILLGCIYFYKLVDFYNLNCYFCGFILKVHNKHVACSLFLHVIYLNLLCSISHGGGEWSLFHTCIYPHIPHIVSRTSSAFIIINWISKMILFIHSSSMIFLLFSKPLLEKNYSLTLESQRIVLYSRCIGISLPVAKCPIAELVILISCLLNVSYFKSLR